MTQTTPTPGQPLSEADVSPCTDCDGTRIATQSERACTCAAGDAYRPHAPVSRPGDGVEGDGPLGEVPDSALKIATELHAAYEQLIYGLPKYLDAENLTDEENMIREAYITLDVTAHRLAAITPPAEPVSRPSGEGETTQHTPCCWGRTSYSDEMAHCYCKPAGEGEGEREAVLRRLAEKAEAYRGNAKASVDTADLRMVLSLLRPAATDGGGLADLAARVTAEVKRGADGSHVQALGALSNIEAMARSAIPASEGGEG